MNHSKAPYDAKALTTALVLGHIDRTRARRMRAKEMEFIGMQYTGGLVSAAEEKSKDYRSKRKKTQQFHEREYGTQLQVLQGKVMEADGAEMKDQLWEERYNWFVEHKRTTGSYPKDWSAFYREKHLKNLNPAQRQAFLEKMHKDAKAEEKKKTSKGRRSKISTRRTKQQEDPTKKTKAEVKLAGSIPELIDHMHESVQK
ncbi:hypothetical protein AAMO2058_000385400 [Amorphochlora amoebiformis]